MNYIISFPRSGQHLTEGVLTYLSSEYKLEFKYCDYYNSCNKIPCDCGSNFQKNHDFSLKPLSDDYNKDLINISDDDNYLVLYRKDMITQLESYYRYSLKLYSKEYQFDDLIDFIKNNIDYYKNFVNKWVIDKSNVLSIDYSDLVDNFNESFKTIVNHFFGKKIDFDLTNTDFKINDGFKCFNTSKIEIKNKIEDDIYNKIRLLI